MNWKGQNVEFRFRNEHGISRASPACECTTVYTETLRTSNFVSFHNYVPFSPYTRELLWNDAWFPRIEHFKNSWNLPSRAPSDAKTLPTCTIETSRQNLVHFSMQEDPCFL